jgi:hypothetical protein
MSGESEFQGSIDRSREALRRSMQDAQEEAGGPLPLRMQAAPSAPPRRDAGPRMELHPFFQGLLEALPEPGAEWPGPERQQWLETARNIFALVYREPAPGSDAAGSRPLDGPSPYDRERSA